LDVIKKGRVKEYAVFLFEKHLRPSTWRLRVGQIDMKKRIDSIMTIDNQACPQNEAGFLKILTEESVY